MPKGPRVHPDVEKYIALLVANNPLLTGKEVRGKVESEFKGKGIAIPSERTIHDRRQQILTRLTIQEKPWSLALMRESEEDTGIPWEAINILLSASTEMQREEGQLWPETDSFMKEIDERELLEQWKEQRNLPGAGVMTVRKAKWLWRIHLALPDVELCNIFWRADMYSHREMMTDYLYYPFDTSDLDRGLMTLLYHIKHQETPTEKETSEKQITGKEE